MNDLKYISKFEIRGKLGEGAMGVVYHGFDKDLQRAVAIKTIHPHLLKEHNKHEFLQRFQREARSTSSCMHPNIITIFEFGVSREVMPYIVMEYIEGEELSAFFDRGIRFDLEESIDILQKILSALSSAHEHNIIHRDIKPGNIFILEDGNVKIADFGIAKIGSSRLTQTGMFIGTPNYMSPEQFSGQTLDSRSDLFSAAVIFYELLTGEHPFPGNSVTSIMHSIINHQPMPPSELNPELPKAFDNIIAQALAKNPQQRFANAQSFARAIDMANGVMSSSAGNNDQATRVAPALHREKISQLNIQKQKSWPAHILENITNDLTPFIGPMASILVRKQALKHHDMHSLCKSLSESIPKPDEALVFLQKSKKYSFAGIDINDLSDNPPSELTGIAVKRDHQNNVNSTQSGGHATLFPINELSDDQMQMVEKKLMSFIGPMASILLQKTLRRTQFASELYQELAEYIPCEAEKQKFLKELQTISN